jgi:hypothetical protein
VIDTTVRRRRQGCPLCDGLLWFLSTRHESLQLSIALSRTPRLPGSSIWAAGGGRAGRPPVTCPLLRPRGLQYTTGCLHTVAPSSRRVGARPLGGLRRPQLLSAFAALASRPTAAMSYDTRPTAVSGPTATLRLRAQTRGGRFRPRWHHISLSYDIRPTVVSCPWWPGLHGI